LQKSERQKQALELQIQQCERQMEVAAAKKVAAAVAAERDEARAQVLKLRKDPLLERAFSQAESRTGGDKRGTFFYIFHGQLGVFFRLATGKAGRVVLEPLYAQGKPLLVDDGQSLTTSEFLEELRVLPAYGVLFQQRGVIAMAASGAVAPSGIGSNGEPINPQAMSAAELRPRVLRDQPAVRIRLESRQPGPSKCSPRRGCLFSRTTPASLTPKGDIPPKMTNLRRPAGKFQIFGLQNAWQLGSTIFLCCVASQASNRANCQACYAFLCFMSFRGSQASQLTQSGHNRSAALFITIINRSHCLPLKARSKTDNRETDHPRYCKIQFATLK
jgi:hypothetical protein